MNKSLENPTAELRLAISVVAWRALDPLFPLVEDLLENTVGDFRVRP